MANFEADVLCVGHASYDLIMMVDHHPGEDEKCFASSLTGCGGGPAANAAVTVSRLGGKGAFSGYLGHDLFGSKHFRELTAEGVNTDLVVRGTHPTPLSVILVKPDGKRTVVNHKADTPYLEPEEIDFTCCSTRALLFDGHEPLISLPLAKAARQRGIVTVLDAGSVHRGTLELAPTIDYLVASEKFALTFTDLKDPELALKRLSHYAPNVVITLGDRGLLWLSEGESGSMPAFRVRAVDTTGAGDTFHGAFALAVLEEDDIRNALRYAGAAAALCCTKVGARTGIPTAREVEAFLRSCS
jgi:sulfofructose kinase